MFFEKLARNLVALFLQNSDVPTRPFQTKSCQMHLPLANKVIISERQLEENWRTGALFFAISTVLASNKL